jgi:hypothetical protein
LTLFQMCTKPNQWVQINFLDLFEQPKERNGYAYDWRIHKIQWSHCHWNIEINGFADTEPWLDQDK